MNTTPRPDAGTRDDSGRVEFSLSRRGAWDVLVAAIGTSAIIIVIVVAGHRTDILPLVLLAALAGVGYGIYRLVRANEDRSVRLRFDGAGIWAPSFGGAAIPWSAITAIDLVHSRSGHHLLIDLQEAEAHRYGEPATLDPRGRRVVYLDPLLRSGPSEVRAAIARFAPQFDR